MTDRYLGHARGLSSAGLQAAGFLFALALVTFALSAARSAVAVLDGLRSDRKCERELDLNQEASGVSAFSALVFPRGGKFRARSSHDVLASMFCIDAAARYRFVFFW